VSFIDSPEFSSGEFSLQNLAKGIRIIDLPAPKLNQHFKAP